MRKISIYALLSILSLGSCTKEFVYNDANDIKENAEQIFGLIDPNQDWRTTTSGTVSITADANLANISKVQILTGSPFFNKNAKILAETEATAGQTVTLSYDAPRTSTRVIAACTDNNGKYYIQAFNIGDKTVSFKSSAAATRAAAITRAGAELPEISLDFNNSFRSYNAERTLSGHNTWKDKNWENDRLWHLTSSGSPNGWTISNSTIHRNATALSAAEEATLQDIFDAALGRYDSLKAPKNNLQLIKESSRVRLYGNHLISTGETAITLSPVQAASTEAYWCDIYYYYYRTEDIPSGTSEADYIKTLPKFKAIDVNEVRDGIKAVTKTAKNKPDTKFLRQYEYLLPFHGNASDFTQQASSLSTYGYTTDGKFYRIYNYSQNADKNIPYANHYITYNENHDLSLQDAYNKNSSDINYQLFQIYTNTDGTILLYNVGSKKFLWWDNGNYIEFKDIEEKSLKNYSFNLTDGDRNTIAYENITNQDQKVYIYSNNKGNCIKVLLDKGRRLMFNGAKNKNEAREWTFVEYADANSASIYDIKLPLNLFPAGSIAPPSTKPSTIIPAGYRIGFMVRKDGGAKAGNNNGKGDSKLQGCVYGYGALNTEINTYGNFNKSVINFNMDLDSPRMATFTANNKVYLTFEEGTDAQFSDIIVEMGSAGDTGVDMFDEEQEVNEYAYTMCFEDRPNIADYDMNDVVLRCTRKSATEFQLSLIATGANDPVLISGIKGNYVSGTELNNQEVHSLFGVETSTFVNTQIADNVRTAVSCIYEVDANTTIKQFLSNIYITNTVTGRTIGLPATGEPPYAIIMPGDFNYPQERISIATAYRLFSKWANNANEYGDWPDYDDKSKIYTNPYNR